MDIKADVVFVTELEASGFMNGVINMAFSTAQFLPGMVETEDPAEDAPQFKNAIVIAPVITANLRFDLRLAQVMRDRLDEIIEAQTRPAKAPN